MATLYNPKIVTDGLVMYLDAANPSSYPRAGTTWTDISGNNNSGSLINSPTFDSTSGGNITLDGISQYIENSNLRTVGASMGNGFTVSYWINTTTTTTLSCIIGIINNNVGMNFGIHLNESTTDVGSVGATSWYLRDNSGTTTQGYITSVPIFDGKWHNVVWSCPSTVSIGNVQAYIDTVRYSITVGTNNTLSSFIAFDRPIAIGARNIRGTIQRWTNAKLANMMYYTRPLNQQEVLQNFNATRSRFGV